MFWVSGAGSVGLTKSEGKVFILSQKIIYLCLAYSNITSNKV
jgi:hypothetical protein